MAPNRGFIDRGFLGPGFVNSGFVGPATSAFEQRVSSRSRPDLEAVDDLSPSRRIELAGGSTGQQRVVQQQPRYDAAMAAADIYGYETERSRGPVSTLFDFLGRGQSAVTGALTGLTGMSRAGDVETGGSLSQAAERFGKGFSGEEKYFFSDFTDTGRRIAAGEEVSTGKKVWNTALGFVIDTALDPITYLSFGGSIMGRMRGANAIRGRTTSVAKEAVESGAFDARRFLREAVDDNIIKSDELAVRLNRIQDKLREAQAGSFKATTISPTLALDDIFNTASKVNTDNKGLNLLKEAAIELVPEAAGMSYARGSSAAVRKWAVRHFGDDYGMRYFDSLPQDLKGGVRIRLPFVRRADGTPYAAGIGGIGAGRLSEISPAVKRFNEMTTVGRNWVREQLERPLGALSGEAGKLYYDAVINSVGRRVTARNGGSSWVTYQTKVLADAKRRELRTIFDDVYLKKHEITASLFRQAEQKYGEQFKESFRRYMYNTDEMNFALENRGRLSESQIAALNTAKSWRTMLDDIGKEAVEVFGDADLAFNFLSDYVPRVSTKREQARRALSRDGLGRPGTTPQWTKHRGKWASEWRLSQDGQATVYRWMPNEDIAKLAGDEVYSVDPTDFMTAYLADVRHALNDQKILNFMKSQGVLIDAERVKLTQIEEAEVQRRLVELVGGPDEMGVFVDGVAQKIRKALDSPSYDYTPGTGAVTPEQQAIGNALANYLRAGGRNWSVDILGIDDVNRYIVKEDGTYINILDGTYIKKNRNDEYAVFAADGSRIQFAGGTNANFTTLQAAEEAMRKSFGNLRVENYYNRYLPDQKARLIQDIDSIFTEPEFSGIHQNVFTGFDDDMKTAYVEKWVQALSRFGMDGAEPVITESGQLAWKAGAGNQPIVRVVREVTEEFKEFVQNFNYQTIDGIALNERGELTVQSTNLVKQKIAQQLADVYAPAKMAEAIQRMFSVTQKPQTFAGEIIEAFYKPFYVAQKAWMTLGRGPGFVARNVLGGSWNNSLAGVGRQHATESGRVLIARGRAQKQVQEFIKKKGMLLDPEEIAEVYKQNLRKELGRSYSDSEVDRLMEAWQLFSDNGLAGNRESARLYGQILRGMNREGKTVGFGSKQIDVGGRKVRIREGTGTTDTPNEVVYDDELSWGQRIIESFTDNPWIRDVMSPMVERSEDYMRFASYLKGIQEIGLEPAETGARGYAASAWVKATQFDYADLSEFEQSLKFVVPFWTWSRYNVPLQIRAMVQQPGRIATALRFQESLGRMFDEDEDSISPSYIADRFGISIPERYFEWLPEWMRPKGDVTLGLTYGEPLADVNELFRDPTFPQRDRWQDWVKPGQVVSVRAVAQSLNPFGIALSEAQRAMQEGGSFDSRNVEDAPNWARALGLAREDPTEPGRYIASRPLMEFFRNVAPPVGMAERTIPWVAGGDREPGRWTTTIVSSMFGLPVATTDDWKKASAMAQRTDFIQSQMKGEFGAEWQYRNEMISRLLAEGAPVEFIEALNLRDMKDNEIDVLNAVHTWRMLRRVELLIDNGVPEDEIIAALSAFVPEGSKSESLVQMIWKYIPKPSSDFTTGSQTFGLKPVSRTDLEQLGLTVNDVRNMSEEEQKNLIYWANRNRGWLGPQTSR